MIETSILFLAAVALAILVLTFWAWWVLAVTLSMIFGIVTEAMTKISRARLSYERPIPAPRPHRRDTSGRTD
jgi:hypothetical protein